MDIDPVQQRTRYPLLIFRHRRRRTRTSLYRIAIIAARAGIHTISRILLAQFGING
jgi:hypothetical protein